MSSIPVKDEGSKLMNGISKDNTHICTVVQHIHTQTYPHMQTYTHTNTKFKIKHLNTVGKNSNMLINCNNCFLVAFVQLSFKYKSRQFGT